MPSIKSAEPLKSQVNIPVSKGFKSRLVKLASTAINRPNPTHFARILLERAVEQEEQSRAAEAVKS